MTKITLMIHLFCSGDSKALQEGYVIAVNLFVTLICNFDVVLCS